MVSQQITDNKDYDRFICVVVLALSFAIYFYVLLLLSLSIVKLHLSTPDKVYDVDDQ